MNQKIITEIERFKSELESLSNINSKYEKLSKELEIKVLDNVEPVQREFLLKLEEVVSDYKKALEKEFTRVSGSSLEVARNLSDCINNIEIEAQKVFGSINKNKEAIEDLINNIIKALKEQLQKDLLQINATSNLFKENFRNDTENFLNKFKNSISINDLADSVANDFKVEYKSLLDRIEKRIEHIINRNEKIHADCWNVITVQQTEITKLLKRQEKLLDYIEAVQENNLEANKVSEAELNGAERT